jgi:hypothetical protein
MTITMATIEQYTPLQIIDYVTPLMLAQNAKSEVSRWGCLECAYRGNDGRKCPVGMLMSDEEYAELEANDGKFKSAHRVCDHFMITGQNTRIVLTKLQSVHDGHDPSQWASKLATLRGKYE